MNTNSRLTLGPFFTAVHHPESVAGPIEPLNLSMEWADSDQATMIPLFRRRLAPGQFRFEHILFRHRDLPCKIECQEYQVVQTPTELFLPLDGLLPALYRCQVPRSIFELLNELSALLPFQDSVSNPLSAPGLLNSNAEAAGFRLNTVINDSPAVHAQIVWEAECRATRFHACTVTFHGNVYGALQSGAWMPATAAGVCRLLTEQLHRLGPHDLMELFSPAGIELLRLTLQQDSDSHS